MIYNEDKALYNQFKKGDKQALEKIVKKYEKNLKYFILKYVKSIDAAEDIFQSVIIYILENKEKYDDQYSLKTYLYTIAKSKALNYIKKQEREILEENDKNILQTEEKLLEDIILSKQRQEKIINVMKKMNNEYQQVIYLTIIEGLSYEETGQVMEKSTSQIKNLLHRARKKMKQLLIEEKVIEMRNNKIIKILLWVVIVGAISSGAVYAAVKIYNKLNNNANLVPTYTGIMGSEDYNTIWVGTFNLVWNELMNEYVHGPVEFQEGNTPLVDELNKQGFRKEHLSEESYYIKYGPVSQKLKNQIEKDIKNKFGKTPDILKNINFNNADSFLIYSMLDKDFEFEVSFDRLYNAKFANSEDKVKYFGLNNSSKEDANQNIDILFYNNEAEFALKLNTKENDEIILYRTDENKSFNKYYEDIQTKTANYTGRKEFRKADELRVPYINIDTTIKYEELSGKHVKARNGFIIELAMQNVKFKLNETGAKLSSEAVLSGSYNSFEDEVPIHFYFDDKFILFMKEKDKELPYMSLKVDNTDVLEIDNTEPKYY